MSRSRVILMILSIAICTAMMGGGICKMASWEIHADSADYHPRFIRFDQSIKTAYESKLHESDKLFEYGIVMLVALWGLLILKEKTIDIRRSDYPELVMFACFNLLFIMFLAAHHQYTDTLIAALLKTGKSTDAVPYIPDPSTSEIRRFFWLEVSVLLSFLVVGILTLFSAFRLK